MRGRLKQTFQWAVLLLTTMVPLLSCGKVNQKPFDPLAEGINDAKILIMVYLTRSLQGL